MSHHYARLSNSDRHSTHGIDDEVQAAFDYREEEDDDNNASESQPLNPNASQSTATPVHLPPAQTPTHVPGTYNFETADYDYPPPGSPPPLSSNAFPNDIGNSNGLVPSFDRRSVPTAHRPWWKRAASTVLPGAVSDRLGFGSQRPSGFVGGGLNNDGVFANVVAKPTAPQRVQHGDETYIVPEDTQPEAPPSYAAAQADAVPPYWETTVHAPFAPDSMGEMIVDSLPTGSLFSFCWNMLVSISFQFVGFLLTYLLHTSHAARLGSRAGLGVTLIQYGFALRGRLDNADGSGEGAGWSDWKPPSDPAQPVPTFGSSQEADDWYSSHGGTYNATAPLAMSEEQANFLADATTEWLSFFLMTIGWFVLLTSILGFYRVKRWERGILASQQRDAPATSAPPTAASIVSNIEQSFALRGMSRIELLRNGFGLGNMRNDERQLDDQVVIRVEEGENHASDARETDAMIPLDPYDPRHQRIVQVVERERRLRNDLRDAGLL